MIGLTAILIGSASASYADHVWRPHAGVRIENSTGQYIAICGGILIPNNLVITAGHCTKHAATKGAVVRIYYSQPNEDFAQAVRSTRYVEAKVIKSWSTWNGGKGAGGTTADSDFGLLELDSTVSALMKEKAPDLQDGEPVTYQSDPYQSLAFSKNTLSNVSAIFRRMPVLSLRSPFREILLNISEVRDDRRSFLARTITGRNDSSSFVTSTQLIAGDSGSPVFAQHDSQEYILGIVSNSQKNEKNQTYFHQFDQDDLDFINRLFPNEKINFPTVKF